MIHQSPLLFLLCRGAIWRGIGASSMSLEIYHILGETMSLEFPDYRFKECPIHRKGSEVRNEECPVVVVSGTRLRRPKDV